MHMSYICQLTLYDWEDPKWKDKCQVCYNRQPAGGRYILGDALGLWAGKHSLKFAFWDMIHTVEVGWRKRELDIQHKVFKCFVLFFARCVIKSEHPAHSQQICMFLCFVWPFRSTCAAMCLRIVPVGGTWPNMGNEWKEREIMRNHGCKICPTWKHHSIRVKHSGSEDWTPKVSRHTQTIRGQMATLQILQPFAETMACETGLFQISWPARGDEGSNIKTWFQGAQTMHATTVPTSREKQLWFRFFDVSFPKTILHCPLKEFQALHSEPDSPERIAMSSHSEYESSGIWAVAKLSLWAVLHLVNLVWNDEQLVS